MRTNITNITNILR